MPASVTIASATNLWPAFDSSGFRNILCATLPHGVSDRNHDAPADLAGSGNLPGCISMRLLRDTLSAGRTLFVHLWRPAPQNCLPLPNGSYRPDDTTVFRVLTWLRPTLAITRNKTRGHFRRLVSVDPDPIAKRTRNFTGGFLYSRSNLLTTESPLPVTDSSKSQCHFDSLNCICWNCHSWFVQWRMLSCL